MRSGAPTLAALSVALAVTGGCTTMANVVLPVSEEQDIGRQMESELARELPLVDDPWVLDYVRGIGERIVAVAASVHDTSREVRFEFDVVDDDSTVNAFAIPGGHIYIYTGLLLLVEDESELAGVIAHEVAHVTQRHIARQATARLGLRALIAIVVPFTPAPATVSELVASTVAQGSLLKYSRDSEREADHVGLEYVRHAGWDPRGMLRFFDKMANLGEDPGLAVLLQTHPASEDRLMEAHERIADFGRLPTETGRERYQQFLERLREARPPAAK